MPELNPEQQARQQIDAQLAACGWVVQDYKQFNPGAGRGIALREVPLKSGTCDYLLLVDRKAVGVIEAKKAGTLLSGVAEQSGHYAENLPTHVQSDADGALPFLYESTGIETQFRDERDPEPRSRRVFAFHRPETLADWMAEADTLRGRLRKLPPLEPRNLRACQVEGIRNLEESFTRADPRALIQMATGAGKTYTACSFAYRLVKHAGARRILFLVDRANLGRQAMKEFQQFVAPDTGRKFTEVYNVQHLTSNQLDSVARVTICTIQRLYSILRGEELDEDVDEKSGYELVAADDREREVAYNPRVPIEAFDFIVTDECHRSIYGLWRQVLEYFDAFTVGLTATPSKQTIGFFNQNLVMEYNHERAVADGVNVGYEVYRIKTKVTEAGGKVEKGFYVDRRQKETRKVRWTRLDEDLVYGANDLDRSVVVKSQIRTVLTAFKDALFTDLFPGRALVPKTLIFCKDDSHAEDVVQLVREVFGKGNDFAKKITYKTYDPETKRYEKSDTLIQEFRTSPQLRIAVTVDMIATGTDIKPLECLLFLRNVRSRTYFEQMKGRGTRVLTPTDLQAVSGADARAKTHFIIVDAVGVCESDKTDSRPLEKKPTVAFDKLLLGVAMGKRDEDSLTTLAGRIARLDREISRGDAETLKGMADGKTLSEIANALLVACDPDKVEAASCRLLAERESTWLVERNTFFNPRAPVDIAQANLPHWRQDQTTYFVTFRLADSLPQEKLQKWIHEREMWFQSRSGVSPLSNGSSKRQNAASTLTEQEQAEYHQLFSNRIEEWLDQGSGSRVLEIPECREIVAAALRHFDGQRYSLGEFVVASNHVHVIVTPLPGHDLSDILHSWKSFTAKEIAKVEEASCRLAPFWQRRSGQSRSVVSSLGSGSSKRQDAASTLYRPQKIERPVWQKESYDHIVRSAASLWKIEEYIRKHGEWEDKRQDAASTLLEQARKQLVEEACAPFDSPVLRDALAKAKQAAEQIIDGVTIDQTTYRGFDSAAKEKAQSLLSSFRAYIEQHKAEIDALQILYSRPYKQRLTEPMLKELEKKLRENHAAWTEDRLWDACAVAAPGKVKGRSQPGRFADLVSLVRFSLEQQPVLKPFAESVNERFNEWLTDKAKAGTTFTHEQLAWLKLIRDHVATSLSIETDDLELSPFNQQGGLGKAHQLFGDQLPKLLDELNTVLSA